MSKLSPMMQQYFSIKENHKEHILFFRLGDFYEMFFDDALLASKELDLTLTGRDCGQEEKAPMCGVPYHSSEAYIQRLIEKGYKVAICEQTEAPQKGKSIVNREVVRVVTAGTVMESSMLKEDKNNYIASIYISDKNACLCFCDVSTGSMQTTFLSIEKLETEIKSELYKFSPSEIIINSKLLSLKWLTDYIKHILKCSVELIHDTDYNDIVANEVVKKQFKGEEFSYEAVRCLWQLLDYLSKTQKQGIEKMQEVDVYEKEDYMDISYTTITNLELFETIKTKEKKGSLLGILDYTKTSFGKRRLRSVLATPLMDKNSIDNRLNSVSVFCDLPILRMNLQDLLLNIADMERLCTKATFKNASPRDVFSLYASLNELIPIINLLNSTDDPLITNLKNDIDPLDDLKLELFNAIQENPPALIKDGGFIKTGYDEQVDKYRNLVDNSMEILAQIEARLRQETNIPKLKVGYNRVFGYYIEVTRSYTDLVPDSFIRKQTLAGAERYITEELKDLEQEILASRDNLLDREKLLFSNILQKISDKTQEILKTTKALSFLDVLASFAQVSQKNNYIKPTITTDDIIEIKDGRHPVVESLLKDEIFIPNDTYLDCNNNRVHIITGPNMAGKSTYMRQIAIISLLCQIGCFVPAKSAKLCIVDSIFTRVGAYDDLSSGRSTFMVEMSEVSEILQNATKNSLVIFDEVGRGTSTFDGMSIAKAIVEYISDKGHNLACKTLFATHYHELTDMEGQINGIVNYNIAAKKRGDDITFLRKIVKGAADDSYGIEVAKLAGVPNIVIDRAKEILKELEQTKENEKLAVKQLSFEDGFILTNNQKEVLPINHEILDILDSVDINVLTPIEAMNILFKLKNIN